MEKDATAEWRQDKESRSQHCEIHASYYLIYLFFYVSKLVDWSFKFVISQKLSIFFNRKMVILNPDRAEENGWIDV